MGMAKSTELSLIMATAELWTGPLNPMAPSVTVKNHQVRQTCRYPAVCNLLDTIGRYPGSNHLRGLLALSSHWGISVRIEYEGVGIEVGIVVEGDARI